jgi:pyrroloquinoline quinone (PQQ) biosynthesis protein C
VDATATHLLLDRGSFAAPSQRLLELARAHAASHHPLFSTLADCNLSTKQVAGLLKNYDAHASVLRRLLLKAATVMPEPAVGFILENVRNEYGNGIYQNNHQLQLKSVASLAGVDEALWKQTKIESGVKRFIPQACRAYYPAAKLGVQRAAIAAGAITATELLAIEEFRSMQKAFARLGLEKHVWFDHVSIEQEHSNESLELALYFCSTETGCAAVEHGMRSLLDANIDLYNGLLAALGN